MTLLVFLLPEIPKFPFIASSLFLPGKDLFALIAPISNSALKASSSYEEEDHHWYPPHASKLNSTRTDKPSHGVFRPYAWFDKNEYIQVSLAFYDMFMVLF